MRSVLLPLDGSVLALRALPFAARIAQQGGRPLVLLRAVASPKRRLGSTSCAPTQSALAEINPVANRLRADGLDVQVRVVEGEAATAIVNEACPTAVGLVVMASHGRGGVSRSVCGSVADAVIRHARVPTLIVPPVGQPTWPLDHPFAILVALDGSALAESAPRPASELADVLGASLLLLRVVWNPHHAAYEYLLGEPDDSRLIPEALAYLEEVAARIDMGRRVEVRAVFGLPPLTIAHMARKTGAGAIAMSTHGRGGLSRAFLGSIAIATLQRSDVPVLLVNRMAAETLDLPDVEERPSTTRSASGEGGTAMRDRSEEDCRERHVSTPP